MPLLGHPIDLNLCLEDGASDKYVQAILRNVSGVELPESPVVLTHVGEGLYKNLAVLMPDTSEVTALYRVFNDSGLTIQSKIHMNALDVFILEPLDDTILKEILAKLDILLAAISTDLTGEIQDLACLIGLIETEEVLDGQAVDSENFDGEMYDPETLTGIIEDCQDDP